MADPFNPFPPNNFMPWAPAPPQARARRARPLAAIQFPAPLVPGVPWGARQPPRELLQGLNGDDADYWHDFLDERFELNNYFAYYRAGRSGEKGEPWKLENALKNPDSILYRDLLENFGRIAGSWENIYRPDRYPGVPGVPRQAVQKEYPPRRPTNDPRRKAKLVARGGAAGRRIEESMKSRGIDIRIKRILGAGGNGVALLCDGSSDVPDVRGKRFVLKAEINNGDMSEEKDLMMVCLIASCNNILNLWADLVFYILFEL